MPSRILVEEPIDPRTAALLREQGHDAVHGEETIGKGARDRPIARAAGQEDRLVLTNETDFLDVDRHHDISGRYCPDNAMRVHDIATPIGELESTIPDQRERSRVTWITDAALS